MLGRIVELCLWILSRLPRRLSQFLGRSIGRLNWIFKTRSYHVTHANLCLCFPDMEEDERAYLEQQSLMSTGQTLMETPAAWLASRAQLSRWISRASGEHLLDAAIAEGKGVIVLLPHIGNWELFNLYYSARGKMTALYQPPRKIVLQEMMKRIRHRFGNELVATNVKGVTRLYRTLEEGGTVIILPDQVPSSGIYVPFFGVDALSDKLISRLVQKTGARVVAASVSRLENGQFEVGIKTADDNIYSADIVTSVRAVNKTVEDCVREIPAQYQWEYKRFRERPTGQKKIYRFNKPEAFH
jgi:KDO2-lipid IV(A) lauroyltransferase